jgi:hypothetical protein
VKDWKEKVSCAARRRRDRTEMSQAGMGEMSADEGKTAAADLQRIGPGLNVLSARG